MSKFQKKWKQKWQKRKEYQTPNKPQCSNSSLRNENKKAANVVIVYQSELDYISRCIMDCPNIETGGQLFGYWTSLGVPVVLYALGPGPKANHETAFFNQDIDYLEQVGRILINEFGLQHMGEWHSHHRLGLARPSGHDNNTIYSNMVKLNIERFLLCIGNCTETTSSLNAFNFHISSSQYVEAGWEIKNIESPFRSLIDHHLANILVHPRIKNASMNGLNITSKSQGFSQQQNNQQTNHLKNNSTLYPIGYWLNEKENNLALKEILDRIKTNFSNTTVILDKDKLVHIIIKNQYGKLLYDIVFPVGFPQITPITFIQPHSGSLVRRDNEWNYNGNIVNSFIEYFQNIKNYG